MTHEVTWLVGEINRGSGIVASHRSRAPGRASHHKDEMLNRAHFQLAVGTAARDKKEGSKKEIHEQRRDLAAQPGFWGWGGLLGGAAYRPA